MGAILKKNRVESKKPIPSCRISKAANFRILKFGPVSGLVTEFLQNGSPLGFCFLKFKRILYAIGERIF